MKRAIAMLRTAAITAEIEADRLDRSSYPARAIEAKSRREAADEYRRAAELLRASIPSDPDPRQVSLSIDPAPNWSPPDHPED